MIDESLDEPDEGFVIVSLSETLGIIDEVIALHGIDLMKFLSV